jgi:hypothetical protein
MSYREKMAAASGLLLISEYEFEHAVFLIKESDLNFQGMQYGYNKIYKFLGLNNKPDVGVTILASNNWLFVSTIKGPYTTIDNNPIYLDGFAYAGLVNIQNIGKEWPKTAKPQSVDLKVFDCFKESSFIPQDE